MVVDKGGIGGQAGSSALIRNYLGFPKGISGSRLAQQAYEQAWVFGARFVFMTPVTELRREGARLVVRLSDGTEASARAVVLATGASYRRLDVPALDELSGPASSTAARPPRRRAWRAATFTSLGGANSAGQAALHLARYARRVTLVVRAASLAAGMSHYLVRQVDATPNVEVRLETEIVGGGGAAGWLDHLVLRSRATGDEERVAADGLFLMIGADPNTGWLPPELSRDAEGFLLTGPDVPRRRLAARALAVPLRDQHPERDGGRRRTLRLGEAVASAVGEGSVAIQFVHRILALDGLEPWNAEPDPAADPTTV